MTINLQREEDSKRSNRKRGVFTITERKLLTSVRAFIMCFKKRGGGRRESYTTWLGKSRYERTDVITFSRGSLKS